MELTIIEILAGLNVLQLFATVCVVWLLRRGPAGMSAAAQRTSPLPVEKKAAFYQGVHGILPGDAVKQK